MSRDADSYLWDRSGPEDPEIAALEDLLGDFGHRPAQRLRHRLRRRAAAVVAAGVVAAALFLWLRPSGDAAFAVLDGAGERVAVGSWIDTAEDRELTLEGQLAALSDQATTLGYFDVAAGSRLRLERVDDERLVFHLERGVLEALVMAEVPVRFFEVTTPRTRCVDLGCSYVLTVDELSGRTHVQVTLGAVAFEQDDRETFIPAGAEAWTEVHGLGTPRFTEDRQDSPEFVAALDAFDAEVPDSDARRDAALDMAAAAETTRHTLPLWHGLSDIDPDVAAACLDALVRIVGHPVVGGRSMAPEDATIDEWREHLRSGWF